MQSRDHSLMGSQRLDALQLLQGCATTFKSYCAELDVVLHKLPKISVESRQLSFTIILVCTLHFRRCESWLNENTRLSYTHRIPRFTTNGVSFSQHLNSFLLGKRFKNQYVIENAFKLFVESNYPGFLTSIYGLVSRIKMC